MPPDPKPPAASTTSQPSWIAPVQPVVPDHELIKRIGGGSYGDVWLARNVVGTWRAVKVVFRDRFTDSRPYDREFAGMLKFEPLSRSNEGFIDILQIGRNDAEGYFYYVMELADDAGGKMLGGTSSTSPQSTSTDCDTQSAMAESGTRVTRPSEEADHRFAATYVPLTLSKALLQRGRLPLNECLELGITLNLALAHLHRAGLIHRDIKPSNIIFVGGVPKLADIGLVIETSEARSYVGTEGFIPPEGPNSPQADLFSLGKVLYEAGMGKDRKDFPEPFTQLVEAPDATELLEFNAILLKACAANANERYRSAEEMNADLALLQSGGSVRRQRTLAKQLRFAQRAGALVTVVVMLVAAGWYYQARQTRIVRQLAEENRQNAYAADMNLTQVALEKCDLKGALSLLDAHRPAPGQRDLRGWEWRYFWQRCRSDERFQFCQYSTAIGMVVFSPDGKWLALRRESGAVDVWDTVARKLVAELPSAGLPVALVFSASNSVAHVAYILAESNGTSVVVLWSPHQEIRLPHSATVYRFAFSPDGTLLVTLSRDRKVSLWNIESRKVIASRTSTSPPTDFHEGVRFSPDGRLIVYGQRKTIQLWEWAAGKERTIRVPPPSDLVMASSFSPDGKLLAASGGFSDNQIYIWDVANVWDLPAEMAVPMVGHLVGHGSWIAGLDFSPDGKSLVSASADQTVRLWDVTQMQEIRRYQGNKDDVWSVAFSPDGQDIVSAGRDGSVRYFDPKEPPAAPHVVLPVPVRSSRFSFAPDGKRFITLDDKDGSASLWDTATARPLEKPAFLGTNNTAASWDPDSRLLALGDRLGNVRIWDFTNHRVVTNLFVEGTSISGLQLSSNSLYCRAVLRVGGAAVRKLWRISDWGERRLPSDAFKDLKALAVSPDGSVLAVLDSDGTVVCWDIESGQRVAQFPHPLTYVAGDLAFSPDGRTLAGVMGAGLVTLWDMATRKTLATVKGNVGTIHSLSFSRDGRRLLCTGEDPTDIVRLIDSGSKRYVASLPGKYEVYDFAQMSPDGNTLVAVRRSGAALLWRAPSWEEIAAAEKGQKAP